MLAAVLKCAALVGVLMGTVSPVASQASSTSANATADSVIRMVETNLTTISSHQSNLKFGGLYAGPTLCVRCSAGPAVAAAEVAALTGSSVMLNMAVKTFDYLIAEHYNRDTGTITPPMSGEGGPDIQTALFDGSLGQATVALGDRLDAAHRATYASVVARGADFLVRNKNLSWYTNGNIVLANVAVMAFAYKLTGKPAYKQDYETALEFAVHPPQQRWPGYGIQYTKIPKRADGADGAAFLTEAGAKPGYDPEYTMMQVDTLGRIYLLNADSRVLRLINLETNQLMERVRQSDWTLDTSGGTRHPQVGRRVSFDSSALTILARHGRADLAPLVPAQTAAMVADYLRNATGTNLALQYFYGIQPATILAAST
jgi:hypothetical protein